jgi:FdhD protein
MTFRLLPNPADPRLTSITTGVNEKGEAITTTVTNEKAVTLYLNAQEIVTMMTINDYPELLALGYLHNQNMLQEPVTGIDYDDDLQVVVVRTEGVTNFEAKLKKRTQTSGCAQGTTFGDLMESIKPLNAPQIKTSWLYKITQIVNTTPSLYLEAGAIHGCALFHEDQPLAYTEDVGRHNAVDKIAGWMLKEKITGEDKIFYTTGRLTSEMVIKCVRMGIPTLVSRSGFTAWGVELARETGITLIGRAKGKRFVALSGVDKLIFDQDLNFIEEESLRHKRKASA